MKYTALVIALALTACSSSESETPLDDSTGLVLVTGSTSEVINQSQTLTAAFTNDTDIDITDMNCVIQAIRLGGEAPSALRAPLIDIASGATETVSLTYEVVFASNRLSFADFECEYRAGLENKTLSGRVDF